jgi:hypothetical protein
MAMAWVSTLLKVYALLVDIGPRLPKAWALLQALYDLFADKIEAAGELEVVEMPAEVLAMEQQITDKLAADGSLNAIDFTRLRKLAKWANESGTASFLISILVRAAAGG